VTIANIAAIMAMVPATTFGQRVTGRRGGVLHFPHVRHQHYANTGKCCHFGQFRGPVYVVKSSQAVRNGKPVAVAQGRIVQGEKRPAKCSTRGFFLAALSSEASRNGGISGPKDLAPGASTERSMARALCQYPASKGATDGIAVGRKSRRECYSVEFIDSG